MKKKYRKAICFGQNGLLAIILIPFWILAIIGCLAEFPLNWMASIGERNKIKWKIYDTDSD